MAGDLYTGTLELIILRTLKAGPVHGYGILHAIKGLTQGVLDVEQGALYPALHRLARRGLLEGEWGENDTGRRARFYSLTPRGRKALEKETARWDRHAKAVYAVLQDAEG